MTHTIKVMYPPAETTQNSEDPTMTVALNDFVLPRPEHRSIEEEPMIDYHEEEEREYHSAKHELIGCEPSRIVDMLKEFVFWLQNRDALLVGVLIGAALSASALVIALAISEAL